MRRRPPVPDLPSLVAHHLDAGRPTGWFEPLYAAAGRSGGPIPWLRGEPHPYLTDWLDDPVVAPPGRRAVVVGCGWGDDAEALSRRGFEVVAFDVAPSAVSRARRRSRRSSVDWRVADLLDLPVAMEAAFDLVVEVDTVPWLPGVVRDAAMHAVASLAAPGGVVVTVTRIATSEEARTSAPGPPWPQAPSEFAAYRAGGLVRLALEHPTPQGEDVLDARLTWQRPSDGAVVSPPAR